MSLTREARPGRVLQVGQDLVQPPVSGCGPRRSRTAEGCSWTRKVPGVAPSLGGGRSTAGADSPRPSAADLQVHARHLLRPGPRGPGDPVRMVESEILGLREHLALLGPQRRLTAWRPHSLARSMTRASSAQVRPEPGSAPMIPQQSWATSPSTRMSTREHMCHRFDHYTGGISAWSS